MKTEYFSARNTARFASAILVLILLTAFLILTSGNAGAKTVNDSPGKWTYSLVGECLGYKTSDALYKGIRNDFCEPKDQKTFAEISPTLRSYGDDAISMPEITATPSPEIVATKTPDPTAYVPTDKPVETATPAPTEIPACNSKNKNDNKKPGENPCDGDAGGGNG